MILLTLAGGIGGFLFGYDTGVISGALPYIRDDLLAAYRHDKARCARHTCAVLACITTSQIGAVAGNHRQRRHRRRRHRLGPWRLGMRQVPTMLHCHPPGNKMTTRFGRKTALLTGDVLFTAGALFMGLALSPAALIAGRALVGLGVGLASVTVPVYIAECAPVALRATLVTVNVLMITTGQFMAYFIDWLCTFLPGTWRCACSLHTAHRHHWHRQSYQVDAGPCCPPCAVASGAAGSAPRVAALAHGARQGGGGAARASRAAWGCLCWRRAQGAARRSAHGAFCG